MAKRRYTDDERSLALAALAANTGNVNKTVRQLGIPTTTLEHWSKGERHPESIQMIAEKKALWQKLVGKWLTRSSMG
jgi:hypothetical protein